MSDTDPAMQSPGRGMDHVAVTVRDLDAAKARFEAMGFTLTPRAFHPWGTANHLAQLGRSFIEIVAVHDRSRLVPHGNGSFSFSAHADAYLAGREGMCMMVFSSADARADSAAWAAAGLRTYEPVYFERAATLPDGEEVKVAFTVCFVTHPGLPRTAFFVCEHHFPQHFWKPAYQDHPNGAADIASATLVVPGEPGTYAAFFEQLIGLPARVEPGRVEVRTACGDLVVTDETSARAAYPVLAGDDRTLADSFALLAIEVPDPDRAAGRLAEAGIPCVRGPDHVDVAPRDCFGVALRFAAGRPR